MESGITMTDHSDWSGVFSPRCFSLPLEMNRVYWVDLGRGTEAEKATTRNLNISFVNNSAVVIDVMVFTVYLDKFILNCETGQVKK